jgi:hypothetical protein
MSKAVNKLQAAVKSAKIKEPTEVNLLTERYKYLNSKLVDKPLVEAANQYYIDLEDGGDKETATEGFIAGYMYARYIQILKEKNDAK